MNVLKLDTIDVVSVKLWLDRKVSKMQSSFLCRVRRHLQVQVLILKAIRLKFRMQPMSAMASTILLDGLSLISLQFMMIMTMKQQQF